MASMSMLGVGNGGREDEKPGVAFPLPSRTAIQYRVLTVWMPSPGAGREQLVHVQSQALSCADDQGQHSPSPPLGVLPLPACPSSCFLLCQDVITLTSSLSSSRRSTTAQTWSGVRRSSRPR
eukprot:3933644-Rhodomonas_salina.4